MASVPPLEERPVGAAAERLALLLERLEILDGERGAEAVPDDAERRAAAAVAGELGERRAERREQLVLVVLVRVVQRGVHRHRAHGEVLQAGRPGAGPVVDAAADERPDGSGVVAVDGANWRWKAAPRDTHLQARHRDRGADVDPAPQQVARELLLDRGGERGDGGRVVAVGAALGAAAALGDPRAEHQQQCELLLLLLRPRRDHRRVVHGARRRGDELAWGAGMGEVESEAVRGGWGRSGGRRRGAPR